MLVTAGPDTRRPGRVLLPGGMPGAARPLSSPSGPSAREPGIDRVLRLPHARRLERDSPGSVRRNDAGCSAGSDGEGSHEPSTGEFDRVLLRSPAEPRPHMPGLDPPLGEDLDQRLLAPAASCRQRFTTMFSPLRHRTKHGDVPSGVEIEKWRILPVGCSTTNRPPGQAAPAGGMRHGEAYQEVGAGA